MFRGNSNSRSWCHVPAFESLGMFLVSLIWLGLFAGALLLAACQDKSTRVFYPPPATPAPTPITFQDSKWQVTVQPLPEPNRYRVVLSWGADRQPRAWTLHRKDRGETVGATQLATLEGGESTYVDGAVSAGENYSYILGTVDGDNYRIVARTTIQIPRDLEITGAQSHQRITGYHRLFLAPGSTLLTQGRALHVEVDEIVSLGGIVSTFLPGATATLGQDGRGGGSIVIRAKRARGVLFIQSRGENGGRGFPGGGGQLGPAGGKGSDGACDRRLVFSWLMNLLIPEAHAEPRDRDIRDPQRRSWETYCKTQPGSGLPGGRGLTGETGRPGGRGGDSARVLVEITDPTGFQVRPSTLVGNGGSGGGGGPGGAGGAGGQPGARPCNECPPASTGPTGSLGPIGSTGATGPTGIEQPICLKLASGVVGDCDRYFSTAGE